MSDNNTIRVPISKGGPNAVIEVDMSTIPDASYPAILLEGLKPLLNAKMSKVEGPKAVESMSPEDKAKTYAAAMTIATKNLADLQAGKSTKRGAKADKSDLPKGVQTEAMRIARNVVKDLIRAAKGYPSQYSAAQITEAAKEVIANDPSIIETAKANIAARDVTSAGTATAILDLIKPDPKKVEAAAKKAAERKTQLSAKQAGKTAPPPRRVRGDAPSVVH